MKNYEIETNKIVSFMDRNKIKNGCDELFPYWEGIKDGNMNFEQFLKEFNRVGFSYCRNK